MLPLLFIAWYISLVQLSQVRRVSQSVRGQSRARIWEISFLILGFVSIYPIPVLNRYYWLPDVRQKAYRDLLVRVKDLSGRVVCPEDPTIPLFSGKGFVTNIYLELDRNGTSTFPDAVSEELERANFTVQVTNWWGNVLRSDRLQELNFERTEEYGPYVLWKKKSNFSGTKSGGG